MRIIAGNWRGKKLLSPNGKNIRPTGDRAKSALFNILENSAEYSSWPIERSTVLDAFCGTGSLGLECLSRGAKEAYFLENNHRSINLLRRNIVLLGAENNTRILEKDATSPGRAIVRASVIFMDPPYRTNLGEKALEAFVSNGWVSAGTLLVIETHATKQLIIPQKLRQLDVRGSGSTRFWFLTRKTRDL